MTSAPPTLDPSTKRSVLRHREVSALLLGQLASQIGDQLARYATAALTFELAHSILLAALAFALSYVPPVFGSVLLAPFADRMSRRKVMLVCSLSQAAMIGALTTATLWHLSVALAFVALIATELFTVPARAAQQALMADIVPERRQYLTASGTMQTIAQSSQVLGLVIGGVVYTAGSAPWAFGIDAVTFLLAFALTATRVRRRDAPLAGRHGIAGWLTDTAEAARLVLGHPVRRALALLGWAAALVIAAPEAVALAYVQQHRATPWAGALLACLPAGAAVGATLVTRRPPKVAVAQLRQTAFASLAPFLCTFADPAPAVAGALWAGAGLLQGFFLPPLFMSMNLATPPEARGRVNSLCGSGFALLSGACFVAVGALAQAIGSPSAAVGCAGIVGLVVFASITPCAGPPPTAAPRVARP